MAAGQKTIQVRDTAHQRTEGTTDIMFVSESVWEKLKAKDPSRYKAIREVKEEPKARAEA